MSKIDEKIAKIAANLSKQKVANIQQAIGTKKSGEMECVNWQCGPLNMISYKD